jgi:hypothetical protein
VRFTEYCFGSVRVDGVIYDHDLIIDRGKIRKRKEGRLQEVPRRVRSHPALGRASAFPGSLLSGAAGTNGSSRGSPFEAGEASPDPSRAGDTVLDAAL